MSFADGVPLPAARKCGTVYRVLLVSNIFSMKVILTQDIASLGKASEVKDVKTGYAINFLVPEGMAEMATGDAVKRAERIIASRKAIGEQSLANVKSAAAAIKNKVVTIKMKAEDGKLFGSVGAAEIVSALAVMGIDIDENRIVLEKHIKEVGTSTVVADFGHDIRAEFTVTVEAE